MDESGPSTSGSSTPFTRSRTSQLVNDRCFFCHKYDDDEQLYQVRIVNAGKYLKEAVERSKYDTLKTRLNTCIASGDAHSIDVRYHKTCWTKHVFCEQREDNTSRSKTDHRASLMELINLIDVQTQNQAYQPMADIETTYINMLGTEGSENHVPTFNRKWLKEEIINVLLHLKSCFQKHRRKSAVLYSTEACEYSIVHSAMESHGDEEDNMQTSYRAAQVIRRSIANFTKAAKDTNTIEVTSYIYDVPAELYHDLLDPDRTC